MDFIGKPEDFGRTSVATYLANDYHKVTDEIKELVLQNAPHEKVRAVAVSQGMRTMFEDAVRLVEEDVIPISEILRRVYLV